MSRRTIDKVSVHGADWRENVEAEIENTCLPSLIGGEYDGDNGQLFKFDLAFLLR